MTDMVNSNNDCDMDNNDSRSGMINEIMSVGFAINELALYLDTHPNDTRALSLHRKYAKEYRNLTDSYERMYGPLTINCPCNKWRWIEEPWPWEGGVD